jgi:hypothetical protein
VSTYTTAEQKAADRRALEAQLKAARETRDAADAELQRLEKAINEVCEADPFDSTEFVGLMNLYGMATPGEQAGAAFQKVQAYCHRVLAAALVERVRPPAPDAGPEMETAEMFTTRYFGQRQYATRLEGLVIERDAAHAADKAKAVAEAVAGERDQIITLLVSRKFTHPESDAGLAWNDTIDKGIRAIRARKDGDQ